MKTADLSELNHGWLKQQLTELEAWRGQLMAGVTDGTRDQLQRLESHRDWLEQAISTLEAQNAI